MMHRPLQSAFRSTSRPRAFLLGASLLGAILLGFSLPLPAGAQSTGMAPVATDSRVKTFVYTENDVFNLLTYYGFQSNIEFGPKETIETVSIGDRAGWQLVPSGRRLFVRAVANELHTNMTVVTNLRAYQFDLRATDPATVPQEELVYVIRFFYPDEAEKARAAGNPVASSAPQPAAYPTTAAQPTVYQAAAYQPVTSSAPADGLASMNAQPMGMAAPMANAPSAPPSPSPLSPNTQYGAGPFDTPVPASTYRQAALAQSASAAQPAVTALPKGVDAQKANFNYTYTGAGQILPSAMLDDGKRTYFQFADSKNPPKVRALDAAGKSRAVRLKKEGDYHVAATLASRFELSRDGQSATIFNESRPQQ